MKKILFTVLALIIGIQSFAQLDLSYITGGYPNNAYHSTIEGFMPELREHNPSVASYKIVNGYEMTIEHLNKIKSTYYPTLGFTYIRSEFYKFVIFKDSDGYVLDIVHFSTNRNSDRWSIATAQLLYKLKRKVVNINSNGDDYFKIIFDDGTYATIKYNRTNFSNSKVNGEIWCMENYILMDFDDCITKNDCAYVAYRMQSKRIDCN